GLSSPWHSVYGPIASLLDADETDRDKLTATWRDNKAGELNFVGIVAVIFSTIITGSLGWGRALEGPPATTALWYSALALALTALASAIQLTVTLNRLSGYPDALFRIRRLLSARGADVGTPLEERRGAAPSARQVYAWESAAIGLRAALLLYIVGMMVLVF
ncbi:hypothetical protein BDY21DRAFT_275130, partial [Lineolata rhizophorae]